MIYLADQEIVGIEITFKGRDGVTKVQGIRNQNISLESSRMSCEISGVFELKKMEDFSVFICSPVQL